MCRVVMLSWLFALAHGQHERFIESQALSAPDWPNVLDAGLPPKPQGCIPPSPNGTSNASNTWHDDDDNNVPGVEGGYCQRKPWYFNQIYHSWAEVASVLCALWAGLLLLWVAHVARFYRAGQYTNLQRFMTLLPLTRVVYLFATHFVYAGYDCCSVKKSELSQDFIVARSMQFVGSGLFSAAFAAVLLVSARGFGTMQENIDPQERRAIMIVTNVFTLSWWCYDLQPMSLFFLFFVMLMMITIVRLILMAVRQNIERLETEIAGTDPDLRRMGTRPMVLLGMFTRFRAALQGFICLFFAIQAIDVLTPSWINPTWVFVIDQLNYLMFTFAVGWTFRLRATYPYQLDLSTSVPILSNDEAWPAEQASPWRFPLIVSSPPESDGARRKLSLGIWSSAHSAPATLPASGPSGVGGTNAAARLLSRARASLQQL